MTLLSTPFYGSISRLSVNPQDNSLWMITKHPMGRTISPVRMDVQNLLNAPKDKVNEFTKSFSMAETDVAVDVLGHNTGVYVVSTHENGVGQVQRFDGEKFVAIHTCEASFGLQGIVGFDDTKKSFPSMVKMKDGGSLQIEGGQNNKLLLVGRTSAMVVDLQEDGSLLVGATFTLTEEEGVSITAWDASTVFDDVQTHHCAFGLSNGAIATYFTDEDSNTFKKLSLLDENEIELTTLHDAAVLDVAYVSSLDRRDESVTHRYLMTTGQDMQLFQVSLLESIAIPRKNQHQGCINGFIKGAFATGDGSERASRFGRFYTLSADNTVRAYVNMFTNENTASYEAELTPQVGAVVMVSTEHNQGAYSEGNFLGERLPTPHLVVASEDTIQFVPLTRLEKEHSTAPKELRANGQMAKKPVLSLNGGVSYVQSMSNTENKKVRQKSFDIFKQWDAEWLVDELRTLVYNAELAKEAIAALASSTHPRRIPALESILTGWNRPSYNRQQEVYQALVTAVPTLHAHHLVMDDYYVDDNLKKHVVGDLAVLAGGNGPLQREALAMLQGFISHDDESLATRVYDFLCGEGEGIDPVIEGVEGVLYGIFSSHDNIHKLMANRLVERGLLDAFETTLILRRLLEDNDQEVRERAVDVSLLRAPNVSDVLRFSDTFLHTRLYKLQHGSFASDADQEALLKAALPAESDVEAYKALFASEDVSVQSEIDVLAEFSACTKDDVSVVALQARAAFGFEGAVQGLLKLSNSNNTKIQRKAVVGLGHMVHLDDAHQRINGITLHARTDFEVGSVAIYHAIKGYEIRNEDPVSNVLYKVLEGGHPKLRETAITIAQKRLNADIDIIREARLTQETSANASSSTKAELSPMDQATQKEIADANEMLKIGIQMGNQLMIDAAKETLADLKRSVGDASSTVKSDLVAPELESVHILLKRALEEETFHINVRKEVYKSFWMHNLEDAKMDLVDKTSTFKLFLNLRDRTLFNNALKDLWSHIQDAGDREWALALFKDLINQDIQPRHHSNIWDIWTTIANDAQGEPVEPEILRIGFECRATCECISERYSFTICTRHRIRRDAFLRVLSASGDWLADFIRDALNNKSGLNKDLGDSAAVLAVSDKAKKAVANMDNPSEFILSMLTDKSNAKRAFAGDLLLMYPKFYNDELKQAVYEMRTEGFITSLLVDKHATHLMTENVYDYFVSKIIEGRTDLFCAGVERFALINNRTESLAKALIQHDDLRMIRKALTFASANYTDWGKSVLDDALSSHDDVVKIAFSITLDRLRREASRSNSDADLKEFLLNFYNQSSALRQLWVVESLKLSDTLSEWQSELVQQFCGSKSADIRKAGYRQLKALSPNESWVMSLLKAGLKDANSAVSELCFQLLLAFHKADGDEAERTFVKQSLRAEKAIQEQAIAMALTTTASWRVPFILEALNDEDAVVRRMMCHKIQSVSGLGDDFFQGLMGHQHQEVREMAMQVLAARGLYRPKKQGSDNLAETILEAPPTRPDWWSNAWTIWYWEVQDWKDRKIEAIIAAGKTHDHSYASTFRKLLNLFGYEDSTSDLWNHALWVTSWSRDNWYEFIILHLGWVLEYGSEDFTYAKKEAEDAGNNRLRVAWNVACSRSGDVETLRWLKEQYCDGGWYNSYKSYIKREYLFEGLFAVDSSVDSEGDNAFTIMQRWMGEHHGLTNDIFRLNMLRLAQQGGPVDFIGIGYTSIDERTVLESVQMREVQYSKQELLNGVVDLLNDATIPTKNPYASSNVGGVWYDVVRLTLELHTTTVDIKSEVSLAHWKSIANMISSHHPQLRARAVNAYFRRHLHGEEKERFQADVENFARQLANTTVDNDLLTQDGKVTTKEKAEDLAFDAYIGLIRKTDFDGDLRGDAVDFLVKMCQESDEATKVLPVLKAALSMSGARLQFQAYTQMIALQAKDNGVMSLNQLIQLGLRSTNTRLKRTAISLIWCTDQLSQEQKVSQLESILKNVNDVASRYAFDLLYAFAGRPAAWDKADTNKESAQKNAKATQDAKIAELEAKREALVESFETYKVSVDKMMEAIEGNDTDSRAKKEQLGKELSERRQKKDDEVQTIRDQIRAAKEQFAADIEASEVAHKASMDAPLSSEDAQTWSDANARRDALLEMAIGAYFSAVRTHAVDYGIKELARRRPYFEEGAEEFAGYFDRLSSVLNAALTSPYSDLVRHTALGLADSRFSNGYKVLLSMFNSHQTTDQNAAINALVQLGPVGLVQYKDADGNPYPRTASILFTRLITDESGTLDSWRIFQAIQNLGDRHSTLQEQLFAYLNKGVGGKHYSAVLDTLIGLTGYNRSILDYTDWADLTPSDFEALQPYLSHELDWEKVSLEQFVTLYQDVYDDGLLATIMDSLLARADYEGLREVLGYVRYTKGFEVTIHEGEATSDINKVLESLAMLKPNEQTAQVRAQAINVLRERLDNNARLHTDAQALAGNTARLLGAVLDEAPKADDSVMVDIAKCLANNHQGAVSRNVFDILCTVATNKTTSVYTRTSAIEAWGKLGDARSVVSLLNIVGLDAYGEELMVDPEAPQLSTRDRESLQRSASAALGGMVFAQEREGIYQLLSTMSRSRDTNTYKQGFVGLRNFLRSEKHAWNTAARILSAYQASLNQGEDHRVQFFATLLSDAFTPLVDEGHQDYKDMAITPETESALKEYILSGLFGEIFEREGEVFNALYVKETVFAHNYRNSSNLESVYKTVRQLVHGPHQTVVDSDGHDQGENDEHDEGEAPMDFSYLEALSAEERSKALKAERKLYENFVISTKYTDDMTKVMASYLTATELLDLVAWGFNEGYWEEGNDHLHDRYNTIANALNHASVSPVAEALEAFRKDYTLDFTNNLPSLGYRNMGDEGVADAFTMLENNLDAVTKEMDAFVSFVSFLHQQFQVFVSKLRLGEQGGDANEFYDVYLRGLCQFLKLAGNLPVNESLVQILQETLTSLNVGEDSVSLQTDFTTLFELYLESGLVDWDFVDGTLKSGDRSLRPLVITYLSTYNLAEVLPRILDWVKEDSASMMRLVDVLQGAHETLQTAVASYLVEETTPSTILMLLARLRNVEVFKGVIDSLRDEEGALDAEQESRVGPILNALAVMATDKAEYYLRDLGDDASVSFEIRQAAMKAAKVAYRRRVPLHVRRADRA